MSQSTDQLKNAFRLIEKLEAELATSRQAQAEPIAIVGLSCRFPGAEDADAFWSLLSNGEQGISEVPGDRWDIDAFYDENPDAPGKMSTRYGGFLKNIEQFDAAFFNISPREAALMDPQQRILLELSWEALENAALSPESLYGSATGVFVGICSSDYPRLALQNVDNINAYLGTGNATSVAAGRLAYTFGFTGPCLSTDTACSSALVAVHLACDSLRKGECKVALAASVNLVLAPETTVAFSKARMMSPDGRCKTFDERADGYVRSEGAGVVVLKTLSQAQAAGDTILAIIKGSAINQDGASGGLTVPNGPSQVKLIRQTLAHAGVRPEQIHYLEAHGTGTALGDPIEVGALADVFGVSHTPERPLLLGSAKTAVGHLEVAAGMAGLIKVVLSLQNQAIPGHANLQQLSTRIPWQTLPFAVPTTCHPWPPGDAPRIAGISSFGFSGTNAHVVVQEAPALPMQAADVLSQPLHLLCLSAKTQPALLALAQRYADWLDRDPPVTLESVCWTANNGRMPLPHRVVIRAADLDDLREKLHKFTRSEPTSNSDVLTELAPPVEKRLAFLFSGQGAQYAGMGKALYGLQPVFSAAIDRCETALAHHLDEPLTQILWGRYTDRLDETAYTQPAMFALEYALAQLWQSWGVAPSYVMGHSVGEYAAACIAGVFSLDDGMKLIAARGRLMQALPRDGAMAVILAGREAVAPVLRQMDGQLSIAAFNAPEQTIVSGSRDAVLALCEALQCQHDIPNQGLLDVSHAFHSPLMRPILAEFRAIAESISYAPPSIGFVSTVTGQLAHENIATANYWVAHIIEAVDFMGGMRELEANGIGALLEIGPNATLIGLARACYPNDRITAISSLRKNAGEWAQMLGCLGTLFVNGFTPNWRKAGRCERPQPVKVRLPTYPFQRQRYWINDARNRDDAIPGDERPHPLLGKRLLNAALPATDLQYQEILSATHPSYLADHCVYDKTVVPAVAYLEMALSGIAGQFPDKAPTLVNFSVAAALVLSPQYKTVVQCLFADIGENRYRFSVFSKAMHVSEPPDYDAAWQMHASGEIELLAQDATAAVDAISIDYLRGQFEQAREQLDIQEFYQQYAALGLQYGRSFQTVQQLARLKNDAAGSGQSLARIVLCENLRDSMSDYVLHPTLLDGCFQSVGAMFLDQGHDVAFLPIGMEKISVLHPTPAQLWAHATLRPQAGDQRVVADIKLIDDDGKVVATVQGLQAVRVDRQALAYATATWKRKLYAINWVPQASADILDSTPATDSPGAWLILCDQRGVGKKLAEVLQTHHQNCLLVQPDELSFLDKSAWSGVLRERFGSASLPFKGIIHLWALDADSNVSPMAEQPRLCGSTLALVQAVMETPNQRLPRLWLLTEGAQAVGNLSAPLNVASATLWGLGRTIAHEYRLLNCTCIDIDPSADNLEAIAADVLRPDAELQIAYRDNQRLVARLNRVGSQQNGQDLPLPSGAYHLRAAEYGSLEHLTLQTMQRTEPGGHDVEIEVCAAAINFKDVLYCLGMLKQFSERANIFDSLEQPLGFECAGRIVRVGAAVRDFDVGDEVFAMASSAMASHVTIDHRLVHRKPHSLTFEQSAALPTVFMTAIYSLENLAKIKAGDKVLIHACAGGVGQAALQIARRAGAEVYGTASPSKWQYLRQQGVAHVMNSRTLDFADEIMQLTDGRGVDIVINSLAGDYIGKSADVLAAGGCFIEIGKIGIWDAEKMAAYRADIDYFSFDLGEIDESEGGLQARLLRDVVSAYEAGALMPLPVKAFPIQQAQAAFRYLAQARNIGKVVLSLPAAGRSADAVSADRSYLVTGGWGALGIRIANSLILRGARQIVLSGRSAPDAQARKSIEELASTGAEIHTRTMDVTDAEQVGAVMEYIAQNLKPLGGIVHAAGVLDDGVIGKQSWERFANVLAPKVAGSWNLHLASQALELDFFVLFSSVASVIGAPGQANYAAANAFMDTLAHYRKGRGLPSLCINWGPWAAAGMAEKSRDANRARFESFGLNRMPADDNIEVFEHLLKTKPTAITVLDVNWAKYLKTISGSAGTKFYAMVDKASVLTDVEQAGSLLTRILAEPDDAREAMLTDYLRRQVASVIGLGSGEAIGLQQPLLALGVDSLMAVELKNRIESSLCCTLNPTLLLDYPTLEALGAHLAHDVLNLVSSAVQKPDIAHEPDLLPAIAGDQTNDSERPLAAMQEFFINDGTRKLCVCAWGDKEAPLAICVHGILDHAATWDELAIGLVRDGYRVMALDLRGHGRSDHHPSGANITVMDFLVDLTAMVAQTARKPFVLIGHSMGSVVCALYAALYPEKVSKLILIEPVMPLLREQHNPLDLLGNDLRYINDAPKHPVYPDLYSAARMLTLNHTKLTPDRSTRLAQRITVPCDGGVRWSWDARMRNPLGVDLYFSRQDYLSILRQLQVGSTRIYGRQSQFADTPVLLERDFAAALSQSVSMDGGHNLHTDNTESLLQAVRDNLPTVSHH